MLTEGNKSFYNSHAAAASFARTMTRLNSILGSVKKMHFFFEESVWIIQKILILDQALSIFLIFSGIIKDREQNFTGTTK